MKSLRFILIAVALMSLSAVAFAQSDAQKSFDKLKTLAGTWDGRVTTNPPQPEMGDGAATQISLRVTSRGNALVHEMKARRNTGRSHSLRPSRHHVLPR